MTFGIGKGENGKVRIALGNLFEPFVASSAGAQGIHILAVLHEHRSSMLVMAGTASAKQANLSDRRGFQFLLLGLASFDPMRDHGKGLIQTL